MNEPDYSVMGDNDIPVLQKMKDTGPSAGKTIIGSEQILFRKFEAPHCAIPAPVGGGGAYDSSGLTEKSRSG